MYQTHFIRNVPQTRQCSYEGSVEKINVPQTRQCSCEGSVEKINVPQTRQCSYEGSVEKIKGHLNAGLLMRVKRDFFFSMEILLPNSSISGLLVIAVIMQDSHTR